MAEVERSRELIVVVQTVLASLRRTLELPFEAQLRQKENEGASLFREILRDLESARLSIAPLRFRPSSAPSLSPDTYLRALAQELNRIIENPEYGPALRAIRYRRMPDPGPESVRPKRIPDIHAETVFEAIAILIGKISEFVSPPGTGSLQRELFQLQAILPAQKSPGSVQN